MNLRVKLVFYIRMKRCDRSVIISIKGFSFLSFPNPKSTSAAVMVTRHFGIGQRVPLVTTEILICGCKFVLMRNSICSDIKAQPLSEVMLTV